VITEQMLELLAVTPVLWVAVLQPKNTAAVLFSAIAANDPETAKLFGTMIDHGPGAVTALSLARQAVIQSEISGAFRAAFVTVALFTGVGAGLAFSMPLRRV
jgi:hypothetical protein